ncbi:hypothetical protein LCGC14_0972480 [marine sediment metagenome]|uniref:FCP1 homology domain-containing protein n=1 Tax=marine sediment metagenome TaxID=412755 RepID=A0A0F9QUH2_9ZZZZ
MKIIFLDIDGVLNTVQTLQRCDGFIGMSPILVKRFNKLVKDTGAEVVLSSTWRLAKNWRKVMAKNGLDMKFLDRTVRLNAIRGEEIQEWLDRHDVEKYVILDDDTDMLPDQIHFKTDFQKDGLTEDICKKVKQLLLDI